jgi:hypothetical protein
VARTSEFVAGSWNVRGGWEMLESQGRNRGEVLD